MSWRCPESGTENDDHAAKCLGCGYVRYGRLVLLSPSNGKEIRTNIDLLIGKTLLKAVVGDEARFASEPQFKLARSEEQASWLVLPNPKAVNATFVNGVKAADLGVKIAGGSEITIGTDKARLKVRVEN